MKRIVVENASRGELVAMEANVLRQIAGRCHNALDELVKAAKQR